MVVFDPERLDFSLARLPPQTAPHRLLTVRPDFYQVEYVINPHMRENVGSVDPKRAFAQWTALSRSYRALGLDVHELDGVPGLPDLVFCANQVLPFRRSDGTSGVVLGRMKAAQRTPEVAYIRQYFASIGQTILSIPLPEEAAFEGTGDAVWHPGRRLLWGGFGFRTSPEVYDEVSRAVDAPVLALRLTDPDFYHLDTCLSVLDERTALVVPAAFDPMGLELLRRMFDRLVEAPEEEARNSFAGNAFCPDSKHVVIQRGCPHTCRRLIRSGYVPIEVDTDEFIKSGGSVFCMKLAHW